MQENAWYISISELCPTRCYHNFFFVPVKFTVRKTQYHQEGEERERIRHLLDGGDCVVDLYGEKDEGDK